MSILNKNIVGTCGYYDTISTIPNGQTIRTLNVTKAIKNVVGEEYVEILCYQKWRKHPLSVLFGFISLMFKSKNVVLFPDQRAYKIIIPLAICLKLLSRSKVFYIVIGGWLPSDIKDNCWLRWIIKRLDGLFVQTTQLKHDLNELGVTKVSVLTNFRFTKTLSPDAMPINYTAPYKICFISRVNKLKGVTELVDIVNELNRDIVRFELDIFGGIEDEYKDEFQTLQFNNFVKYRGELQPEDVSKTMSGYFLHVLPTKYRTEGFPGSILDGFYVGVPTLVSKWNSVSDVVNDNVDGVVFEFGNFEDMRNKLMYAYINPDKIIKMKYKCLQRGVMYQPNEVIKTLTKNFRL